MNITLDGKTDFADVVKLKTLRWGDYAGLYWWAQFNPNAPSKWNRKQKRRPE